MKYYVLLSVLLVNVMVMEAMDQGAAGEADLKLRVARLEKLAVSTTERAEQFEKLLTSLIADQQVRCDALVEHESRLETLEKNSTRIQRIEELLLSLETNMAALTNVAASTKNQQTLEEEITRLKRDNELLKRSMLNAETAFVALTNALLPKQYHTVIAPGGDGFNAAQSFLSKQVKRIGKQQQKNRHALFLLIVEQMRILKQAPEQVLSEMSGLTPDQIDEFDLCGTLTMKKPVKREERKSSKSKSTAAGAYRSKIAYYTPSQPSA